MLRNELIIHKESTESTNRDMAVLIEKYQQQNLQLPNFQTIIADYQKKGRGQGNNCWHSEPGKNLLATIHFTPPVAAAQQFRFNQYFALAVRRTLLPYCSDVKVKWPNDIYVDGKKIAGILIEHSVMGDTLAHTMAGIGLNVNETDFPADLPNPVSLKQITACQYDINGIATQLLAHCMDMYDMMEPACAPQLANEYLSNMYRFNEWAPYAIAGRTLQARIQGVDPFGRLLLTDKNGNSYCCGMKEVAFL